jgi:hypothetical protein
VRYAVGRKKLDQAISVIESLNGMQPLGKCPKNECVKGVLESR